MMVRSSGNATIIAASPISTLFGVSMPASPCGTLAAVTRPSWAPSGVDIDKKLPIPYRRPDQPDELDADVARCPGCAGVDRID
jgi:hypothetical protein